MNMYSTKQNLKVLFIEGWYINEYTKNVVKGVVLFLYNFGKIQFLTKTYRYQDIKIFIVCWYINEKPLFKKF